MATLFFSYTHKDEALRDQLEIHLSSLKRRGVLSAWHDRRILAGEEFGEIIDQQIQTANVILLLVSPDFIASDYCYQREMSLALERHRKGEAKVVPVILRPCDWHDLPFGNLLAVPEDGRPITMWPNLDHAFLDVVTAIKEALQELGQRTVQNSTLTVDVPSSVSELYRAAPGLPTSESRSNSPTWIWTGFGMRGLNTSPGISRTPWTNW